MDLIDFSLPLRLTTACTVESNHLIAIGTDPLSLKELAQLLDPKTRIELTDDAKTQITNGRNALEKMIATGGTFYGINTGFGSLCDTTISTQDIATLQKNLIRSHAAGTGPRVDPDTVRLTLALKVISLRTGNSGIRLELVQRLVDMYNRSCLPVVYEYGSLGASGDLAPLAHIALTFMGEGEFFIDELHRPAMIVNKQLRWSDIQFEAKEGLALINGTQYSTAMALRGVLAGWQLFHDANRIAALSIEGFNASLVPFDDRLHQLRPHAGQIKTATEIRNWLSDSELHDINRISVQDPYAFRCIPQVHGATYDALAHATHQLVTEANSVTDNPNIFPDDEEILSGGNFHAQPVALVADYTAIALAELGSISERRTYQMLKGHRGLPVFLTQNPGLNSGLMITQYTAASLVSANKQLATPASVDSIVSCNGQEDHVSMAANAGNQLMRVAENTRRVLAIELIAAAQAFSFRKPRAVAPALAVWHAGFLKKVPTLVNDRMLQPDIEESYKYICQTDWVDCLPG
jgi:histidine ammonia-lyase